MITTTIGVLALQGDFAAHAIAMERAGARTVEVRNATELTQCDGLILPGGESTTMLRLLDSGNLFAPLREFGLAKPIYGTCAGAILLATSVSNPTQRSLQLMDIAVQRNAYGRQAESHIARLRTDVVELDVVELDVTQLVVTELEAVFIRAPIIRQVGVNVRVLATHLGDPVWITEGMHMVTTFHPELTSDLVVHRHFLQMVRQAASVEQRMLVS